ncbi:MAG: DUF3987 domain-containing protein [Betaproteobacteria bacterium]
MPFVARKEIDFLKRENAVFDPYRQIYNYPVDALPKKMGDALYAVMGSTKASEALVVPIILSAAAAAVQGVADVQKPYSSHEDRMPTSMFFGAIANSGDRKTSALKQVLVPFEEFEQGLLQAPQDGVDGTADPSHHFLLEEATEKGVVDLLRRGAKSLFYALDEGALLFDKRLDVPALCKRFDGATIRHASRTEGSIFVADTRASMCMLTQGVTFDRIMNKKGYVLVETGLLPRILMSFCTGADAPASRFFTPAAVPGQYEALMAPFHERLRSLLRQYARSLGASGSKRQLLTLNPQAANLWTGFAREMEYEYASSPQWLDVRVFVMRAAEHALRLAAVLHCFSSDDTQVAESSVQSACRIVMWHLGQAKKAFGEPPTEIRARQLAGLLYDYLARASPIAGPCRINRSQVLRCGPPELRKAAHLNLALYQLQNAGQIVVVSQKGKEEIALINHRPPMVSYDMVGGQRLWP